MKKSVLGIVLAGLLVGSTPTVEATTISRPVAIGSSVATGAAAGVIAYFIADYVLKQYPQLTAEQKLAIKIISVVGASSIGGFGVYFGVLQKYTPEWKIEKMNKIWACAERSLKRQHFMAAYLCKEKEGVVDLPLLRAAAEDPRFILAEAHHAILMMRGNLDGTEDALQEIACPENETPNEVLLARMEQFKKNINLYRANVKAIADFVNAQAQADLLTEQLKGYDAQRAVEAQINFLGAQVAHLHSLSEAEQVKAKAELEKARAEREKAAAEFAKAFNQPPAVVVNNVGK